MIYGFFDDSGKENEAGNPYVVMAGYFGSLDGWMELSRQWIELAIRHGITGIHMRDLIPLAGEYRALGWDAAKRDAVMAEFLDVIRQAQMTGIGIAVDTQAWRAIKKEHAEYAKWFGSVTLSHDRRSGSYRLFTRFETIPSSRCSHATLWKAGPWPIW